MILDYAAGELAAVVRTYVFDGVELSKDVEDGDERSVDLDLRIVSRRNAGGRRNCEPSLSLASH
jgi:hypothetical protein